MSPKARPPAGAKARIAQLEAEMAALARSKDLAADGSERSDAHHHPAEAATDADARERQLRSLREAQRRQEAAGRAKDALANGTYGRCLDCSGEIPEARLRIRPDAERCVPCQQVVDRRL